MRDKHTSRKAGPGYSSPALPPVSCRHPEAGQHVLFRVRDYISGDHFSLRRCGRCLLVRTAPQPQFAESERYYPPEYYADGRRYVFPVDYLLNRLQARRSKRIHRASGGRRGSILDIGCGRGLLLNQLRMLGWTVTGTELSDRAAHFARTTLQLDVRVGDVRDLQFASESFDAIVLWHVLEHVSDPASLIHEASRLLRPEGVLLVAVPNFGSFEARFSKSGWFHLDVPRHLSHFTMRSLTPLLRMEGFACDRTHYFSPEYDFFSLVQSALNVLGIRQNSLYELLRSSPAKVLRRRESSVSTGTVGMNLALAPLLGLLSLVVVPVVVLLRGGATMTVYARKIRAQSTVAD